VSSRFNLSGSRHAREVVDDFLACDKTLEGTADWQDFGEESRLKWPISVDGILTDASLDATAYPFAGLYPFTITLNFPPCIWRLEHGPGYLRHDNPLEEMSQFDRTLWGPHYHSWADNRRLAKANALPPELEWARQLPEEIRKFEHAIRWLCGETKIMIRTEQVIELPPKGFL
jgi:hypothetical protein